MGDSCAVWKWPSLGSHPPCILRRLRLLIGRYVATCNLEFLSTAWDTKGKWAVLMFISNKQTKFKVFKLVFEYITEWFTNFFVYMLLFLFRLIRQYQKHRKKSEISIKLNKWLRFLFRLLSILKIMTSNYGKIVGIISHFIEIYHRRA